jgi:hypothetical protein
MCFAVAVDIDVVCWFYCIVVQTNNVNKLAASQMLSARTLLLLLKKRRTRNMANRYTLLRITMPLSNHSMMLALLLFSDQYPPPSS